MRYADGPSTAVHLLIDAPADAVWELIADPSRPVGTSDELQSATWGSHTGEGPGVGSTIEGANRNVVLRNAFRANGWALKTMANATGNLFERNTFDGNAFDVGTNSTSNVSRFQENYWDRYRC